MITLKESAGDIRLCKFIGVLMDRIPGVLNRDYDPELGGYFQIWSYGYNTITGELEDDYIEHSDIIDNLPFEIQKEFKHGDKSFWGFVDWFVPGHKKRFYLSHKDILTPNQLNRIKQQIKDYMR